MTWNKRIPLLAQEGWLLDLKSEIANRQVRNKDVQYPQQLLWLIAHGS